MSPTDRLWCSDERVVRISTVKHQRRYSLTGYLVADELVLTCAHDVADAETREVCLPSSEAHPAQLLWPEEAESDSIDVALLRVPGLRAPAGRVLWGEYTDYVGAKAARCIGFPRAERENGAHHAARIDGGFVPGQGSGKGRMQFDFASPDAIDQRDWSGLSGAMILDDHALLGILAERSGTRERRFNAIPATLILEQETLRELLGDPELLSLSDPHPLVRSPFEPLGEATEFKLITARYGQVPFVRESHGDVLDALTAWCFATAPEPASGCDVALRLVTGPAGAGKTRLAAELCRRVSEEDPAWRAGFALDDQEAPWGSHLPQTPLLVVFDYVERSAVTAKVIDFLKHLERLGERLRFPVRILLISRAAGGWYDQLSDQGGTLLQQRLKAQDSPRIALRRGDFGPQERAAHFRGAYARFTNEIDNPIDSERFIDLIEGAQYDSPLLVHIAALLAASGSTLPSPDRGGLRDRLLGFLLQRERDRRWAAEPALSTTNAGPAESDQALHAVAIMTLTGPTILEAAEFLKASELWADQSNAARREAAKALARLYPAEDGRTAPIEPDLVSEHLVAGIEDLPAVTASLHKMPLNTDHFARMLHLLTLTHDHYPDAVESAKQMLVHALTRILGGEAEELSIAEILDQSLARLIEIAVGQVDRGEEAEVANLLSSALKQVSDLDRIAEVAADVEILADHDDGRLAELGQTLYDIKVRYHREKGDAADLMAALEGAARGYLGKDRFVEAFNLLYESINLRLQTELFTDRMWAVEAMQQLRGQLEDDGLFEESVNAAETLIRVLQATGTDAPSAYAGSLSTLERAARKARREDRLDEARNLLDRTVGLRQELGLIRSSDFLPAIDEYEKIAAACQERFPLEAMAATMEALRLRQHIGDIEFDAYRRNFERLDAIYRAIQRVEPEAVEESATLLQWLATQDHSLRPEVADALEACGSQLWWGWRRQTALIVLSVAVEMRRRMARDVPRPDVKLARALAEYGLALWSEGQRVPSLQVLKDAEAHMRAAAGEHPDLWPEAIRTMEHRVVALWGADQYHAAVQLFKESESIERGRDRFRASASVATQDSRRGWYGASRIGADLPGMKPSLKVQLLETIVEDTPGAYSTLATALEDLSRAHAEAGELEAALESVSRAVDIRRKLAEASPRLHGRRLLDALRFMVFALEMLQRSNDAKRAEDEAETLVRKLKRIGGIDIGSDGELTPTEWMRGGSTGFPEMGL
ncbi:trypsin-like peptidase domain-containing protein [Glycomyces luteolus]|uniref:Trypsin-like peptidase domain-containing protein n=1 Tax=Glycomyces luteolus TaxID=2670330 RepID=A0A9X3P976_9ACTN|nr:trypsin-like peptidase domain-containing protein [Glycomyces luteolus]MDA1361128.1 trypsin-like peptidase domain-containing protein [Glycomyces luteolus]